VCGSGTLLRGSGPVCGSGTLLRGSGPVCGSGSLLCGSGLRLRALLSPAALPSAPLVLCGGDLLQRPGGLRWLLPLND
jgi:hypothetical protein